MKKKIIFAICSINDGGAEKVFVSLVSHLKNEFDISVIIFDSGGIYEPELRALQEIRVHTLNKEKVGHLRVMLAYRRLIKAIQPDQIISFLNYTNALTYLSSLGLNVNFILSQRSTHRKELTDSLKDRLLLWVMERAYQKAFRVVAVSHAIKEEIKQDFGIPDERVRAIHNGLDFKKIDHLLEDNTTEAFRFDSSFQTIMTIGRMDPAKNYPMLLRSFSDLLKWKPSLRLIILGKGPLEQEMKALSEKLELSSSVFFLGFILNPYPYLAKADLFVMSSDFEGFPNSLIEAMYVNGHVISTNCPTGPNEIITPDEDGLLVEVNNKEKFTDAMRKMLSDMDLRKKLYENSRKKIKSYSVEKMIRSYANLLNESVS